MVPIAHKIAKSSICWFKDVLDTMLCTVMSDPKYIVRPTPLL
jgi:hypothetical protein